MTLQFDFLWLLQTIGLLFWFVLLPGVLIQQIVFRNEFSYAVKAGFSFATGFILFSIFAFMSYLLAWRFEMMLILSSSSNILLGIALAFPRQKKIDAAKTFHKHKTDLRLILYVLAMAVGVALISLYSGWFPRGDAAIHLQVIRSILSEGVVENACYSLPGNPLIPDHVYDTYYVLIVCISCFSGIELSIVWHYLSPLFSFMVPFVLLGLLSELTQNKRLIAFSLTGFFIIAVFYSKIQYGTVFDAMVYPNRVYFWLLLPFAFTMFFRFVSSGNFKTAFAQVLVVAAMLLVHQNGFLFFLAVTSSYLLLGLLLAAHTKAEIKRMLVSVGMVLIFSAPFLYLKLIPNLDYIAKSSSEIWHRHYHFFYLSESLFAFSFKSYYVRGMIASLIFVVLLLLRSKTDIENRKIVLFASAGLLMTFFIVFNPFVVPWLSKIISYVAIIRMLRIPAYFIIAGLAMNMIYLYFLKKFPRINISVRNWILVSASIGLLLTGTAFRMFSGMPDHELPLAANLKNVIPENSTVLSDSLTSTDIAEFMKINALIIQFNGASDLVDMSDSKNDLNHLLRDSIMPGDAFDIIGRHRVDYIVINPDICSPVFRFDEFPQIFETKNNLVGMTVYKVNRNQLLLQ